MLPSSSPVIGYHYCYRSLLLVITLHICTNPSCAFFIIPQTTTTKTFTRLATSSSSAAATAAASAQDGNENDIYTIPDLRGKVAIVTGASRGIGKGIALELGRAGMTVYVASRSSSRRSSSSQITTLTSSSSRSELTVEKTAEEINNNCRMIVPPVDTTTSGVAEEFQFYGYGGRAIPVPMDVSNDDEISALIAKVRAECGRLDAVICSAFTIPPNSSNHHQTDEDAASSSSSIRDEFWKQGAAMWDACFNVSLRGSYMTCCESVPLMIETVKSIRNGGGGSGSREQQEEQGTSSTTTTTSRPLIAIISSFGAKSYTFNVAYGVSKAGADRLVSDMAVELSKHNIDTISIYPGIVRTENNLEMERNGEWNAASGGLDLRNGETPQFTGRAVASLLSKSELRKSRSGEVVVVAELAKELGFTDVDGRTPPSIRDLKFLLPNFVFPMIEKQMGGGVSLPSWMKDNVPEYLLPWSVFSGGPPPTME